MITNPFTRTLSVLALLAASAGGEDLTLEPKPFTVRSEFACVAIPAAAEAISIDAERWSDFTVEKILDHGSAVKEGEPLVEFKSKTLTHALEDQGRAVETAALELADAQSALAAAEAELPIQLAAARAKYQRVADDFERFTKIDRPAEEQDAKKQLEMSEFRLKSTQEELTQLLKMYAADDLTEETEEFILERQKKSVEMAEFSLKKQQLATAHTLQVGLPRQAEDYGRGLKQAKIALDRAEAELPRGLDRAKIAAATATAAHQRATDELEDLKSDSAKLTLKAPVDGRFYHGVFRDGKWVTGDLIKGLVKGGKVGTVRPFATVVPEGAKLKFMARVKQDAVRGLAKDAAGKLRLEGYAERPLGASVLSVEPVPGTDGLFLVGMSAEVPEDLAAVPGTKAKAEVQVHSNPEAIVVPKAAIRDGDSGSRQVEVRLADGETEQRDVKIGRSSGDDVEILSGLEAGQAIVVPEKK